MSWKNKGCSSEVLLPVTMNVLMLSMELLCYSGNLLSGMIARNIYRMKHKTFINKIFLAYFSIDCVIGIINPFFLFKLFRERLEKTCDVCLSNIIKATVCLFINIEVLIGGNWSYQTKSNPWVTEKRKLCWSLRFSLYNCMVLI